MEQSRIEGLLQIPMCVQVLPDLAQQDPAGMDLLTQLLQYDPSARITARKALRHPFFAQCARDDDAAAGGGTGEAAAAGPLTPGAAGPDGCRPAEETGTVAQGSAAAGEPAAASKPPLPRVPPSKRQCLRSAPLPASVAPSHLILVCPTFIKAVTCVLPYLMKAVGLRAGSQATQTVLSVH